MNNSIIQPTYKLRRSLVNTGSADSFDDDSTFLYVTIYYVLLICIVTVILKTIFLSTCKDDHQCNIRFNPICCMGVSGCPVCFCACCMDGDDNDDINKTASHNSGEAGCDCKDCCDCENCCLRCGDATCTGLCNACCNMCCELLLNAIFSC